MENILGETKKETKARFSCGEVMSAHCTGPAGGLGGGKEARTNTSGEPPAGCVRKVWLSDCSSTMFQ